MRDSILRGSDNSTRWFDRVPNGREEAHRSVQGSLGAAETRAHVRRIARPGRRLPRSLTPAYRSPRFVVRGARGNRKPLELRRSHGTSVWPTVEKELQHR